MINQHMTRREWALLLGLSVLWGGSFFFVEVALDELAPLTLVWLRVSLAAAALWGYILLTRQPFPRKLATWLAFGTMGLLNNILPFSLIAWSQQDISAGLASILNATTPLFTVVVAGLLLPDEKMTGRKIAGTVVGFSGILLLIGLDVLAGVGDNIAAQMAMLCAAISYAFAGVYGRRFKGMQVKPVTIAAGQLAMSALILLPLMLLVDGDDFLAGHSMAVWLAIGGLAVFSTALAYFVYFRLLESVGASNLLLVTFLIPVSAITLGTVFLAETLRGSSIAGMLLIGVGMSIIDGRLWTGRRGKMHSLD